MKTAITIGLCVFIIAALIYLQIKKRRKSIK